MLHKVSEKIVLYAVSQGIAEQEKSEEYIYGMELVLALLANSVAAVIIGAMMGMALEAISFWFVYSVLKKYTGGFHFDSSLACWLSTCIMTPLVLLFMRYCPYNAVWYAAAAAIAAVILLALSPVAAVQKPLSKRERQVFGRIARILVGIAAVVYVVFFVCGAEYALKLLTVDLVAVALFAAAGKVKEKRSS